MTSKPLLAELASITRTLEGHTVGLQTAQSTDAQPPRIGVVIPYFPRQAGLLHGSEFHRHPGIPPDPGCRHR